MVEQSIVCDSKSSRQEHHFAIRWFLLTHFLHHATRQCHYGCLVLSETWLLSYSSTFKMVDHQVDKQKITGSFLVLISQAALLILSATDGTARIFLPHCAAVCSERESWNVSLVIQTHVSRVAPDRDLWRTLYRLSYSTTANRNPPTYQHIQLVKLLILIISGSFADDIYKTSQNNGRCQILWSDLLVRTENLVSNRFKKNYI